MTNQFGRFGGMRSLLKSLLVVGCILAQAQPGSAQVTINGAGSTFAYPMYSKWFDEYRSVDGSVQFNYQSIGSGAGIKQLIEGTIDFGGTDGPMTDEQLKSFHDKWNAGVLHFPTAIGAVLPVYNIPGVDAKLNFTGAVLAGIYLGKITKWNDPAIASVNPGVKLPDSDVVVVHRSDGSGTTYVWLDYLAKVNPESKAKIGVATSVSWPVGLGGKGNEGIAGLVKQTPGSIGYVELIYALQNRLVYGKVQNSSGKFIEANLDNVTSAAAGAAKDMPADFRVSITNAPGADAYPIASFTWLLIPNHIADAKKKESVVKFAQWSLKRGQELLPPLSYAKVPTEVLAMEEKALAQIK